MPDAALAESAGAFWQIVAELFPDTGTTVDVVRGRGDTSAWRALTLTVERPGEQQWVWGEQFHVYDGASGEEYAWHRLREALTQFSEKK